MFNSGFLFEIFMTGGPASAVGNCYVERSETKIKNGMVITSM